MFLSAFAHNRPSPFFCTYPTKKPSFKPINDQFIDAGVCYKYSYISQRRIFAGSAITCPIHKPCHAPRRQKFLFGRPFLKRFALCYRSVVCLSVLSVCNVGALWPNDWIDQDETWRAGRPRPWPYCVRWGPTSPPPKGHSPPIIGPYLLRPIGCMDQDATWYGARPRPGDFVLDGDPAGCIKMVLGMEVGLNPPPLPKRGRSSLPNVRPMSIVAKQLDGSRWHLAWRWALDQATLW